MKRQRADGREEKTQIDGREPDGNAQQRKDARLIQPRKIKSEHQHTRDGQQIKRGAQNGIQQLSAGNCPCAGGDERRADAVIQIFFENADAESHAANEAPLIELVSRVGQQNQGEDDPDDQHKQQQMQTGKPGPIRADASEKIKHAYSPSYPSDEGYSKA